MCHFTRTVSPLAKTSYIINVQHLSTFTPILDSFSWKFSGSHVHPYVRRQLRVIVASILWWDTARLGWVAPARSKLKLHEEWYKNKRQKLFQHTHTYILCHICIQHSLKKANLYNTSTIKTISIVSGHFPSISLSKEIQHLLSYLWVFSPPRPFEGSGCGWVSRDLSMGENPMPKLEPRSVTLVGWSIMGNLIMTGLIAGLKGKPKGIQRLVFPWS